MYIIPENVDKLVQEGKYNEAVELFIKTKGLSIDMALSLLSKEYPELKSQFSPYSISNLHHKLKFKSFRESVLNGIILFVVLILVVGLVVFLCYRAYQYYANDNSGGLFSNNPALIAVLAVVYAVIRLVYWKCKKC